MLVVEDCASLESVANELSLEVSCVKDAAKSMPSSEFPTALEIAQLHKYSLQFFDKFIKKRKFAYHFNFKCTNLYIYFNAQFNLNEDWTFAHIAD